jgi:tripartite-type tricarboxylate transporter receptor subunit TctC
MRRGIMARNSNLGRQFADRGVELVSSTPEDYAAFIKTDITKWQEVVRETGIKMIQKALATHAWRF